MRRPIHQQDEHVPNPAITPSKLPQNSPDSEKPMPLSINSTMQLPIILCHPCSSCPFPPFVRLGLIKHSPLIGLEFLRTVLPPTLVPLLIGGSIEHTVRDSLDTTDRRRRPDGFRTTACLLAIPRLLLCLLTRQTATFLIFTLVQFSYRLQLFPCSRNKLHLYSI